MTCQCGSIRIIRVVGKCSDMFSAAYNQKQYEGYVLRELRVGGGDYLDFSYCADCGQIQKFEPIHEATLTGIFDPNINDDED